MRHIGKLACIGMVAAAASAATASASSVNPWSIGVVSLGNIGSAANPYTADFQGNAAAVGNAYFTSFSLDSGSGANPSGGYSYYGGGTFSLTNGRVFSGGVQTSGDVTLTSASIDGNLNSGGSLFGSDAQVNGNAVLGGTNQSPANTGVTVTSPGTTTTHQAYNPSFNVSSLTSYFESASSTYNQASDASYTNQYGAATIDITGLSSGTHYVSISGNVLAGDYGVTVKGNADQTLIVNVTPSNTGSVSLNGLAFTYADGISQANVLVNTQATSLTLSSGNSSGKGYDLLAPYATTTFASGSFYGELVVGSLAGGGEQDGGPSFAPPEAIVTPEPAPIGLLAVGAIGMLMLGKRRGKNRVA